ncbi:hypothetical protein [Micromonospora sp. NPDC049679]|uniref:hypothetical protein n=1 Tax=Micromonospora sp. NPDC049679 TaxID=3155920 RepID=UPI00340A15CE
MDELGARVRTSADELPLELVTVAVQRLHAAAELLLWVRQASADPMGVPQLAHATEHAEHAGHALRVAQEQLTDYLTAIGLGATARPAPDRAGPTTPQVTEDGSVPSPAGDAPRLSGWWSARVAELTGGDVAPTTSGADGATGSDHLLRLVVAGVRAGDRSRLRHDLGAAHAPVGLGLSALTPPALHRLAGDLLGHQPRAEDVPRLARATAGRVRDLLPGMPQPVLDTLLARVCRDTAGHGGDARAAQPSHPADLPVAGAVLTGVLLQLLGRDPEALDRSGEEPCAARAAPGRPDRATHA